MTRDMPIGMEAILAALDAGDPTQLNVITLTLDVSGMPDIDLTGCDLLAIRTSPGFAPPFEWVAHLFSQARAAGVPVWIHPELIGRRRPQSPGMRLPQEDIS